MNVFSPDLIIGRLKERVIEKERHVLSRFKEADPTDSKAIRELQNELKIPDLAMSWLVEEINKCSAIS